MIKNNQKLKKTLLISITGPNGESCKTGGLDNPGNDFEKGETNVFTGLGAQCHATQFKNGLTRASVEHSGSDGWCFLNLVIELDNGEKFKFDNPRKHKEGTTGQSDWLRNEKREGNTEKISEGN